MGIKYKSKRRDTVRRVPYAVCRNVGTRCTVSKVGCWFLAFICACVGMGIDYGLIRYHKPGTLHAQIETIYIMVLFSALFWLLAWLVIPRRDTVHRVPTIIGK